MTKTARTENRVKKTRNNENMGIDASWRYGIKRKIMWKRSQT